MKIIIFYTIVTLTMGQSFIYSSCTQLSDCTIHNNPTEQRSYECCTKGTYDGFCISSSSYDTFCVHNEDVYHNGCTLHGDCDSEYRCCSQTGQSYEGYCIDEFFYESYCPDPLPMWLFLGSIPFVCVSIFVLILCLVRAENRRKEKESAAVHTTVVNTTVTTNNTVNYHYTNNAPSSGQYADVAPPQQYQNQHYYPQTNQPSSTNYDHNQKYETYPQEQPSVYGQAYEE
eukprot:TRINITY_DN3293_c0_g1_i1.p2 TRINITY_DN3293_c0_g1~~TRINITY_DN3293_c0_g1_i1.p2  ORF type:complete len:229 (+),score=23.93 TRINITY_DN3293_c0_g1_i1:24-710(+)